MTTRRALLRDGARLSLVASTPFGVTLGETAIAAAVEGLAPSPRPLPAWSLDVDGNGVLDATDRRLLERARAAVRGHRARAARGYDHRRDVLGRGRIGPDAGPALAERLPVAPLRLPPRPIVAAWHYGWYNRTGRRGQRRTARYVGGRYASGDRRVEEEFNALREEFGLSVDLLSWIDRRGIRRAWRRGYLAARSLPRRRFGLLYESMINLDASERIDFSPRQAAAAKLIADFRAMAEMLLDRNGEPRESVFRIDGRPVVYVFASHMFGTTRGNLGHVGNALVRARAAFAAVAGALPYLIGDEALFPGDAEVGVGRRYRAALFDAIGRYHHYDVAQIRELGGGRAVRLDARHRAHLVANERRSMDGFADVRNRFSGAPVVVVPSSAAGFAKAGLPTLRASREDYRRYLVDIYRLTVSHLRERRRAGLPEGTMAAPLVIAGSWNEEFEGHALMPTRANPALMHRRDGGFDWLYALRSVYGWNHYAERPMP